MGAYVGTAGKAIFKSRLVFFKKTSILTIRELNYVKN